GPPEYKPLRISVGPETPPPQAIADLLASIDSEKVREYCRTKGWIVKQEVTSMQLERNVTRAVAVLQSASLIVLVCGIVYVVYRLFAGMQ
nr:protein 3A [Dromedary camel enterovirus 19CC]